MSCAMTPDFRIHCEIRLVASVIQTLRAEGHPRPPWPRPIRNSESSVDIGNIQAPRYPRTHSAVSSSSSERLHGTRPAVYRKMEVTASWTASSRCDGERKSALASTATRSLVALMILSFSKLKSNVRVRSMPKYRLATRPIACRTRFRSHTHSVKIATSAIGLVPCSIELRSIFHPPPISLPPAGSLVPGFVPSAAVEF